MKIRIEEDHLADLASSSRAEKVLLALLALEIENENEEGPTTLPSRSYIEKLMDQKLVTVNGKPCAKDLRLKVGDEVEIQFPEPVSMDVKPENIPIEILYQDEHIVVVNKPQGLTVHPSETQATGTLVHALLYHVKDLSGIGGVARPGIVHRLDKGTSGVLVVSKTDDAHRKLVEMFAAHSLTRKYLAICYGAARWKGDVMRVETQVGRNPKDRKKMAVLKEGGRTAITTLRLKESYNVAASLIEAELETGRTHQVRIHLTHLGHSIIGDTMYGEPTTNQPKWKTLSTEGKLAAKELPAQALHAYHLEFDHPVTGKHLIFTAEPPAAFTRLLEALRKSHT